MSVRKAIQRFKHGIVCVFDDDLSTKQWHNIADWVIISMIILSTIEIFLSTFELPHICEQILEWVDRITLAFFTIEVSLRIWVAPEMKQEYKGFFGRVRYCCTFHGAIDVLSTYPFYISLLFPLSPSLVTALRTLRAMRLFRIARYMKSFRLITRTVSERKREVIISMQFLVVITIILSMVLYFSEHATQPDVYENGFISIVWSFAQYLGEPGAFVADAPPATSMGKVVAFILGLLGIAIVAVPAGILGAGFTDAIAKEENKENVTRIQSQLHSVFQSREDRYSNYSVIPPFRTMGQLLSRIDKSEAEIIEAVNESNVFRIVNLADTVPLSELVTDRMAVEYFPLNCSYGCKIDRGSSVTIISPTNVSKPCTGNFAFYVALLGGFNYISREVGELAHYKSFYLLDKESQSEEGLADYRKDVEEFLSRPKAWGITILSASGADEPTYPTHFHFGIGAKAGMESRENKSELLVHDVNSYTAFFNAFKESMQERFELNTDNEKYYSDAAEDIFLRRFSIPNSANNIIMRVEYNKMLWDARRILIAENISRLICERLSHSDMAKVEDTLMQQQVGFEAYLSNNKKAQR